MVPLRDLSLAYRVEAENGLPGIAQK